MVGQPKPVKSRIRRGGKGRWKGGDNGDFNKNNSWTIYHSNLRGFESKQDSLVSIINQVQPNVITLNETMLKRNKKPRIYGYFSYAHNRSNKSMGGVATCIANKEVANTISMKYGENDDEFIVTRHNQFCKPINIINLYGEQESRVSNDEVETRWNRIVNEIESIERRGEETLLIGDLNKHVGDIIPGNHEKCSFGGKLVKNLLNTGKFMLVNASNKVEGGPFTRYDPAHPNDETKKSCLELVIVSKNLFKYVEKLIIDKNLSQTPGRVISKTKIVYPDHYSITLKFKNIPLKPRRNLAGSKYSTWNTNKEGGWSKFKEITGDDSKLADIGKDTIEDATKTMKKINVELDKCKFQAFGKVTVKNTPVVNKEIDNLFKEKSKLLQMKEDNVENDNKVKEIENNIAGKLLKNQREKLEKEIAKLKEIKSKKGKSAVVFKLKENVLGSKKAQQEPAVVKDPATEKLVTDVEEIKRISLEYCVDLLTNRKPSHGYEELIEKKKEIHEERMNEVIEDDEEFSEAHFDECLKILKQRNNKKYDFILKAGNGFRKSLLALFRYIWTTEDKPEQWRRTTLIQLHKKGCKDDLSNYRNIHTKLDVPKLFGFMVITLAKVPIIQNMSKFQIGTVPGHRSQEHLFVMKNVISLYSHYKQPLILQLYDIQNFFDREMLVDGMDAIYNSGVKGKLYRLLYLMNKDTIIKVKTGVGMTDEAETGENIGQGTGEGAILSAASIADGVEKAFANSEHELSYGEEELKPLLFQDDIGRICDSVEAAQHGNDRVAHVMESKLLDFNIDKSCFLVVGNVKEKQNIRKQLQVSPITLSGFPMKEMSQEKYLGDYLHCNGNPDSVAATVQGRSGLAVSAVNEIRSVLEDCRVNVAGGLCAGIDIWELSVLPFLLNNCSVWADIPKGVYEQLENIQKMFYRYLFATPISTPTPALLWETGGLTMQNRIKIHKLSFYHHLVNLETSAVASRVATVAQRAGYPGLMKEYQELCSDLKLPNPKQVSKLSWKRLVKKAVTEANRKNLLEIIQNKYEKLDYDVLKEERYEAKEYLRTLNLYDARLKFAIRSKMVQTVAFNYSSDPKHSSQLWHCTHCDRMDSQTHILSCDSYLYLRNGKDLSSDKDLVTYFREVISLREKLENVV